jgi:hypothetical protein
VVGARKGLWQKRPAVLSDCRTPTTKGYVYCAAAADLVVAFPCSVATASASPRKAAAV